MYAEAAEPCTTRSQFNHDRFVESVAEKLRTNQMEVDEFDAEWITSVIAMPKYVGTTAEQVRKALSDAINIFNHEKERGKKAKIEAFRKKTAARRKALKERDTSTTIPVEQINKMEAVVRDLVPEDILADYNADLTVKSGAITYRDIAFIACLHFRSVSENGRAGKTFEGTSPMKRITKASVSFGHREKPFDNRQVRYALDILEVINFTIEIEKAIFMGPKHKANRAGKWELTEDPAFSGIF